MIMLRQAASHQVPLQHAGSTNSSNEDERVDPGISFRAMPISVNKRRGVQCRRAHYGARPAPTGFEQQTTNLGVRSSNLFGRASKPLNLDDFARLILKVASTNSSPWKQGGSKNVVRRLAGVMRMKARRRLPPKPPEPPTG